MVSATRKSVQRIKAKIESALFNALGSNSDAVR